MNFAAFYSLTLAYLIITRPSFKDQTSLLHRLCSIASTSYIGYGLPNWRAILQPFQVQWDFSLDYKTWLLNGEKPSLRRLKGRKGKSESHLPPLCRSWTLRQPFTTHTSHGFFHELTTRIPPPRTQISQLPSQILSSSAICSRNPKTTSLTSIIMRSNFHSFKKHRSLGLAGANSFDYRLRFLET